jgi:hypothetical protein
VLFRSKASLQAYAVINVDSSTGTVSQAANNVPATIVYGTFNKQKIQQTFGNGDSNSTIVISTVNGNHANSVRPFESSKSGLGYEWFNCEVSNNVDGFDLNINGALGKITSLSNFGGTATAVPVAKSLKGAATFEVPSATKQLVAMGTAALSINTKYTVYANTNTQTVAQMVTIIQADLAKKKFVAGNVVDELLAMLN